MTTVDGDHLWAATVLLCAGAHSGRLTGFPVHPVKGQILRLKVPERLLRQGAVLTRTVRALVRGQEVYLVPRGGRRARVVLGASQEQQGLANRGAAGGRPGGRAAAAMRPRHQVDSPDRGAARARAGQHGTLPQQALRARLSRRDLALHRVAPESRSTGRSVRRHTAGAVAAHKWSPSTVVTPTRPGRGPGSRPGPVSIRTPSATLAPPQRAQIPAVVNRESVQQPARRPYAGSQERLHRPRLAAGQHRS